MAETAKRILVAEDNAAMADVIRFNLERAGFQVHTARTGDEAWGLLQRQPVDLLISDFQMPGMTGGQLCRRIRGEPRLAGLPVILLTAKSLELDAGQYLGELAVTVVIPKPFSPRELTRIVRESLARQTAEA